MNTRRRGEGLTALVTGASEGIGRELARCCAADGFGVLLVARRGPLLQDLARALEQEHRVPVSAIAADLAQPGAAERLWTQVESEGRTVDLLINNAGFGRLGRFDQTSLGAYQEMMQLNIVALTELSWLALRPMVARQRGWLLNVSSTAAFQAGPLMSVYYASKAYVLSLTEAIGNEIADTGVHVSALCPGMTRSGFHRRAGIRRSFLGERSVMDPEDVAETGYRGLMAGRRLIVPGLVNKVVVQASRLAPRRWSSAVARRFQGSPDPGAQ